MGTLFSDIYARAIFRFADYDFLKKDFETRENVLEKYLISAKTDFQKVCKFNLNNYDLKEKCFADTLGDEEIEILALGVAFYWVSYKALNSELLKNVLNSKDYYFYSPANLLKEVQALRETLKKEFHSKIVMYSYNDNQIDTLKA